ncbi:MAG: hypothetical protein LRY55_03225, partial [Leadbetterella sp.]|nr:hypothetical protein [Leadbetterella sp.]
MKNILFFLLFPLAGAMAQHSSLEAHRVAEWNFEEAADPLKSATGKTRLSASAAITAVQGIAHLPAGVVLKADLGGAGPGELTYWMRFQVPP